MSRPASPMWMAHHHPEAYERCVVIGGHHVCRRCLALYPAMVVVTVVQIAGWIPDGVGIACLWLAPLGVVADWIGEHLGDVAYSPRRQTVVTLVASVSFGVALGRHLVHPFEAAATVPAVVFTALCLAVWAVGARRRRTLDDWESEFENAEQARRAELEALLARAGQPASATKSMSSSTAPTSDGLRSL